MKGTYGIVGYAGGVSLLNANLHTAQTQKLYWSLTLILLMYRIWWAPNNASEWQIGFNSAFKGLISRMV